MPKRKKPSQQTRSNLPTTHVALPGSERREVIGARLLGPTNPSKPITVTLEVRRRQGSPSPATLGRVLTREDLTRGFGGSPEDMNKVRAFALKHGLRVVSASLAKRTIVLAGTVEDFSKAFLVTLQDVAVGAHTHRQRVGPVMVPNELASIIEDVRGLDDRPTAAPHYRLAQEGKLAPRAVGPQPQPLSPIEVARRYSFPPGDGQGQTIAIIELGGGFSQDDLAHYFQSLGLPVPTVTAVSEGAGNNPGPDPGSDGEVMLDIQVAGAVAPRAKQLVFFAPNTDQGFLGAIQAAIHDSAQLPTVISISWGGPESNWKPSTMLAFDKAFQDAAALGIPVFVAAGDDGASDGLATGLHTDFPASAPHALGCGGTDLLSTGEVVWNGGTQGGATGGGVSSAFPKPGYQNHVSVPSSPTPNGGRGVPDVSGCGGDLSPYKVRINGRDTFSWGTSAVAPLWSGLTVRLAQQLGRVPFLNPLLYNSAVAKSGFTDITKGDNDLSGGHGKYQANVGWDACTGLGSPNGVALLQALKTVLPPKPSPLPKPNPMPTSNRPPTLNPQRPTIGAAPPRRVFAASTAGNLLNPKVLAPARPRAAVSPIGRGDFPNAVLKGSTAHFNVYYDPPLGSAGQTIAAGVMSACEADYVKVQAFFGGITPPGIPFNVIIANLSAAGGGGAYHYTCAGIDIYCDVQLTPTVDPKFTEALNVAELVEVFEAAQNKGFDCGSTNGEGLSRVLATASYPSQLAGFSTAADWLDNGRPDYVNKNKQPDAQFPNPDGDPVSNGCGVLFLNYLSTQLKHSWADVVKAAGTSLQKTYAALTGDTTNPFPAFKALLDSKFPPGNPSGLTTDNPWPIKVNPPSITSPKSATGQVGASFSYKITATNNPTNFGATGLPGGLSVNASTGVISGTPTGSGSFQVTVSAKNAGGAGTAKVSLTVKPKITPTHTPPHTTHTPPHTTHTPPHTTSTPPPSSGTGVPPGLMWVPPPVPPMPPPAPPIAAVQPTSVGGPPQPLAEISKRAVTALVRSPALGIVAVVGLVAVGVVGVVALSEGAIKTESDNT